MSAPSPVTSDSTVVVVGGGHTGFTAVKTLRAEGFAGSVVLLGSESSLPYRRTAVSKDLLAGDVPAQKLALAPESFYSDNEIETRTCSTATTLDTTARTVTLDDGERVGYDALLLATGASARTLPMVEGTTLRGIDDVAPLLDAIDRDPSLVVVGGGLIGCEVAAAARALGAQVSVLESAHAPLSRIAPAAVSELYRALHAENGVEMHLNVRLESTTRGADGRTTLVCADGRRFTAGTVLVSVGSQPNVSMAENAGLSVDGGVIVDRLFRTSAENVYAAGDVASVPNPVLGGRYRSEHWNGAAAQGSAAARAILGIDPGELETPWGWSTQYGRNLQFAGWTRADSEYVVRGSITERMFVAFALEQGALVGAIGMGRPKDIRTVRSLVPRAPSVDRHRLADESVPLAELDALGAGRL